MGVLFSNDSVMFIKVNRVIITTGQAIIDIKTIIKANNYYKYRKGPFLWLRDKVSCDVSFNGHVFPMSHCVTQRICYVMFWYVMLH